MLKKPVNVKKLSRWSRQSSRALYNHFPSRNLDFLRFKHLFANPSPVLFCSLQIKKKHGSQKVRRQ